MATIDRDGSPKGAVKLGLLKGAKTKRGTLNSVNDDLDYYSFNLSQRSSVEISLAGLQDNADLALIKGNRVVAASSKKGKQAESISRKLDAGSYKILVTVYGKQTNYVMRAEGTPLVINTPNPNPSPTPTPTPGTDPGTNPGSGSGGTNPLPAGPTPIAPASEPGSLPALAFDTGVLNQAKAYRDTVGVADTADYYSFTVGANRRVKISTGNATGEVTTTLVFDINGNGFVDPGDVITSGDSIEKSLGAGQYFVGVSASTGASVRYDLLLESSALEGLVPSPDPFIGLGGARDLGVVNGLVNFKQLVGSVDSADIYKFTLNSVSNFTAVLNSGDATGAVTMALLYDSDNNGIANPGKLVNGFVAGGDFIGGVFTSGGAGGTVLPINKTLGAGTYYIAVTQKEAVDNSVYDFSLFVNNTITGINPTSDPGSNGFGATDVTLQPISDPVNYSQYKQFVGSVDDSDFYRLTLTETTNIIITYNGSPEPVILRFGQDFNNNGVFDPTEDKNNNDILDFEDGNLNGIRDPGEDLNGNSVLDTEDLNGNGILDPNEHFEGDFSGNVVYSPLPPLYDGTASYQAIPNGFFTSVPTNIYAKLGPGTYYLQVDPQAITTDLGDGLVRYGSANVLYNVSFLKDQP
jgi:hypothetical protein